MMRYAVRYTTALVGRGSTMLPNVGKTASSVRNAELGGRAVRSAPARAGPVRAGWAARAAAAENKARRDTSAGWGPASEVWACSPAARGRGPVVGRAGLPGAATPGGSPVGAVYACWTLCATWGDQSSSGSPRAQTRARAATMREGQRGVGGAQVQGTGKGVGTSGTRGHKVRVK